MTGVAGVIRVSVFIREAVVGVDDANVLFITNLVSHDGRR